MSYIKIFQNVQALSVSIGNYYSEDQLIHNHQGGIYSTQIASHQEKLRREEQFNDKKYLSTSALQADYLNMDSSSGSGRNSEREKMFRQSAILVEVLITLQKNVSKGSDRKKKNSCGWLFGKQTWGIHSSQMFDMWI